MGPEVTRVHVFLLLLDCPTADGVADGAAADPRREEFAEGGAMYHSSDGEMEAVSVPETTPEQEKIAGLQ